MIALHSRYDAVVGINVPADKARAVVEVLKRDMLTQLATKSDLDAFRRELVPEFAPVRQEWRSAIALLRKDLDSGLAALRKDLTIWLGSVQIVGMGLLFAALKLA